MTNAKDQNLYVNMFGSFSMQYGLNTINDLDVRSRKSWIILGYLIAYRNRAISQSEIIDIIYPEGKSDNPANALKTMIHRVRSLLDALNFVSGKVMILQSGGSYMWNKDLPLVLDVDSFENLCQLATSSDLSDDQRLQYYLDAIEIYKGDFLSKLTMESWVTQLNTYYHTMYIHAVHQAITLFIAKEDYPHIVELCSRALTIDAYDEFFHYNLILSLTKMQNSHAALVQYRKMTNLFYTEFGITPSKKLTALYKEIIKLNENVETDLSVIKENLRENIETKGAYHCEYEVFKDVYRLEVRSASRVGNPVYLCLITLMDQQGETPTLKHLNSYMEKLGNCICASLRRGDIYARYSIAQYILMLPGTTYENGQMVANRIDKRFRSEHPNCPLLLDISLQALDIML